MPLIYYVPLSGSEAAWLGAWFYSRKGKAKGKSLFLLYPPLYQIVPILLPILVPTAQYCSVRWIAHCVVIIISCISHLIFLQFHLVEEVLAFSNQWYGSRCMDMDCLSMSTGQNQFRFGTSQDYNFEQCILAEVVIILASLRSKH